MSYSLIKYAYSLSADYALKLFALTCLLVVQHHLKSDNRLKLCLKWAKNRWLISRFPVHFSYIDNHSQTTVIKMSSCFHLKGIQWGLNYVIKHAEELNV